MDNIPGLLLIPFIFFFLPLFSIFFFFFSSLSRVWFKNTRDVGRVEKVNFCHPSCAETKIVLTFRDPSDVFVGVFF